MTALEWAEVFEAGLDNIPSAEEPAANALALALEAMRRKAIEIHGRSSQ
jgi:hypothetical protein